MMAIEDFYKLGITIWVPTITTDGRNNEVKTWDEANQVASFGWLHYRDSNEEEINRSGDVTTALLTLAPTNTVLKGYRVLADGYTWEVDGVPKVCRRKGAIGLEVHHLEVRLRVVNG